MMRIVLPFRWCTPVPCWVMRAQGGAVCGTCPSVAFLTMGQCSTSRAYICAALHQERSWPQSMPYSMDHCLVCDSTLFTNHSKNMLSNRGTCCSIYPTLDASTSSHGASLQGFSLTYTRNWLDSTTSGCTIKGRCLNAQDQIFMKMVLSKPSSEMSSSIKKTFSKSGSTGSSDWYSTVLGVDFFSRLIESTERKHSTVCVATST
mmetsp:Transcript_18212/g.40421  ORF Transcript_18212/g.40421 Transcript_18212/m.40421 type:complete len:204 (+) Transcript_18212:383-994(+)